MFYTLSGVCIASDQRAPFGGGPRDGFAECLKHSHHEVLNRKHAIETFIARLRPNFVHLQMHLLLRFEDELMVASGFFGLGCAQLHRDIGQLQCFPVLVHLQMQCEERFRLIGILQRPSAPACI